MGKSNGKKKRRRVIALLTREEMEFLDKLGMDSLFSTGSKLSRVDIISTLVKTAIILGVSAQGVSNKQELIQKILETIDSRPDRRKYPRLKKNLAVHFRRMDSMKQYLKGATRDIGAGGFRADVSFLHKPFSINQAIEITINEPQEGSKPIKAIGRVAWVKDGEDVHGHEIGVMLTYIKKEDKERFLKYLSEEIEEEDELKMGGSK